MRTTIELSTRTHTRLRARAAEEGMRGFSAIVEEALERHLDRVEDPELGPEFAAAEGAWTSDEVEEWERARDEAWATWQPDRSSTPTS